MFVGDEVRLDVSFAVARERLARLSESGALFGPSEDAYRGLVRVGVPGVSKLVRVQFRELSWTDGSAGLAMRWEATGAGSGLFPVLDADLRLASDGANRAPLSPSRVSRSRATAKPTSSRTSSPTNILALHRPDGPRGQGPKSRIRRAELT